MNPPPRNATPVHLVTIFMKQHLKPQTFRPIFLENIIIKTYKHIAIKEITYNKCFKKKQ